MSTPTFINKTILVETHIADDGHVTPLSFVWDGNRYRINETGRQWDEPAGDAEWRCYLVRAENQTFELRLNPASGSWLLARAWLDNRA
jgi:hypothetical protein